jgi:hypothetical protein
MAANTLWKYIMLCGAQHTNKSGDVRRGDCQPHIYSYTHVAMGKLALTFAAGKKAWERRASSVITGFGTPKNGAAFLFRFVATKVKQNELDQHRLQHLPGYQNPRCIIESATK